jgi:hypothetical protein
MITDGISQNCLNNPPPPELEPSALLRHRDNLARVLDIKEKERLGYLSRTNLALVALKERLGDNERYTSAAESYAGTLLGLDGAIANTKDRLSFARPAIAEDIAYRDWVRQNFGHVVRASLPQGLPLCFHGAPIYKCRDILSSGSISSSVDRIGTSTSYDAAGEISVTTAKSIDVSLDSYTGLNQDNYLIPAGCLFAVLPATPEDVKASETSMLMGNVDFKLNPEQLVGIITTPENIDQVRSWTSAAGLDPGKVIEFKDFSKVLESQGEALLTHSSSLHS